MEVTNNKNYKMLLKDKYGPLAVVAGASEGIGAEFSRQLAAEGMDLLLIARRKTPLEQLARILEERYSINVSCIVCDLSADDAAQIIKEAAGEREINLLVYNAALSYIGPFENNTAEQYNKIAITNMVTPLKMIHLFGETMIKRGRGAIILMSSLAGFQGSGFLSVYAGTKAFSRILAEGLWYEWKNLGVDVIACCAGATSTPNFINTRPGKKGPFAPAIQHPGDVVRDCLMNLGKKPSVITGRGNRFASLIMHKILPRKMAVLIMGNTTRKMYRL